MEELSHFVGGRDFWNQQQLDTVERKMRSKIAARRRRQDPKRREHEREKNLMAMRRRREDPEIRERERERNRIAMRLKRQDPEFREKEKQAMKMRRLTDPEVKEKDKIAHRIRRQNHDVHEIARQRRKHLVMQHFAQHLELAESVGSASFFLSEVTRSDLWRSPLAMEQTHLPRCTDEVDIIPFEHAPIKQEEVESSDSVDMVASYNEDIDVKEEQGHEVEMDPSLAATMMSVVIKDDSNASSGDVEELVVEPSLLEFKCFDDDDNDADTQEEDRCLPPTLILLPGPDNPECFLDEYGNYENAASESKRLKYALKKSRSGVGGRHAGAVGSRDAIFRCPHCYLCLTSSDYLNRHMRRGCRFRDAPIKNAYRCTQCGAGFSNYGELFQHKRRAHSEAQAAAPPSKANAPSKPRLQPSGFADQPRRVLPSSHRRLPQSSAPPESPVCSATGSASTPDIAFALSSGLSISCVPLADLCAAPGTEPGPRAAGSSERHARTPDLVVSSSSAVNHFEPVVPDVAANSNPPDVAALAGCLAPDIVSCSRPGSSRRVAEAVVGCATAPGPRTVLSAPPDVVASAPRDVKRQVLPSGGGSLARLNCSALKRRNPEASPRSAEGARK